MNKILLFAAALVALFYSCEPKDSYSRISREDWTMLIIGDTLVYKSNMNIDTFIISDINNYEIISDKHNHYEHLRVYYRKLHYDKIQDSIFTNESWYYTSRTETGSSVDWRNLYSSPEVGFRSENDTTINLQGVVTPDIKYLQSYKDTSIYPYDVKKVYYSNLYGVVQYELFNGEVYMIDNNCLNKFITRKLQ